ncbi:MAG: hypothetical protein SGPRY_002059 [Prymnesium sp.]
MQAMRVGYRAIHLRGSNGNKLRHGWLLVHINVDSLHDKGGVWNVAMDRLKALTTAKYSDKSKLT